MRGGYFLNTEAKKHKEIRLSDLKHIEENIPKEIKYEISTLYDLGVETEEIEYLIYLKVGRRI